MKIKICGQTSVDDCDLSVRYGADFIGVVIDVEWSPRSLSVDEAAPIFQKHGGRAFLLSFNMPEAELIEAARALNPHAIQLTGQETPETCAAIADATGIPVYKSIHLSPEGDGGGEGETVIASMKKFTKARAAGFVLDTKAKGMFGGTGVKSDWSVAAEIVSVAPLPVFLAGGINPGNVAEAAATPGIYGIDLASGVEYDKGKKSEEKIAALFAALAGFAK